MKMRVRSNFACRKDRSTVRLTMFTIRLGLLLSALVALGQAVNSSPSFSVPANATQITTVSPSATALGQTIEQTVLAQSIGAVSQSANPAAVAATAATPTVTLSASRTALWTPGSTTTLTWTSVNATACHGTGKDFLPSGVLGSLVLAPVVTTTYRIACTGAGGSASQSVTVDISAPPALAMGMTVASTGTTYVYATSSKSTPPIGGEAQGNQGAVVGGPVSANGLTWWQVAFDDDLTGWTYQSGPTYVGLAAASPKAPTLTFGAIWVHCVGRLIDAVMVVDQGDHLQRNRLLSTRRVRIRLSLADGKHDIRHHLHRPRRIDDLISGGDLEPGARFLCRVAPGHLP